jgi:hypothetical protein
MTSKFDYHPCPAARAIDRLVDIRDQLELAARPPGEIVTISRQAVESILNDLGVASCAIREMSE